MEYEHLPKTRSRRSLIFVSIAILAIALGIFFDWTLICRLLYRKLVYQVDEEPYRTELTPCDVGKTRVRFYQPTRRQVSPDFLVGTGIGATRVLVLNSPSVAIPGGSIEYMDLAPKPGRVKIRFGTKLIDVMESQLFVDGIQYDWEDEPTVEY